MQKALRRQHMLDLTGADAKRQRTESAVGRGVAISANYRHAGLSQTLFGADNVDNALFVAVRTVERNAKLTAVLLKLRNLRLRHFDQDGQGAVMRGNAVGCGANGQVRPPDL